RHHPTCRNREQERTAYVDREETIKVAHVRRQELLEVREAGVTDQHVHAAEARARQAGRGGRCARLRHIADDGFNGVSAASKLADSRIEVPTIGWRSYEHQPRAFRAQAFGHRTSDPAAAARHDRRCIDKPAAWTHRGCLRSSVCSYAS